MLSSAPRLALLAAIGIFGFTAQASAQPVWGCMTDDGYGRKMPCSASYKASNPNWKGSDACHTKKGGKMVPCTAAQKAKFTK